MKKYLTTLGLLTCIGAFIGLQSGSTHSYAANSRQAAAYEPYQTSFHQDTVPGGDTSMGKHKKKHKDKSKYKHKNR